VLPPSLILLLIFTVPNSIYGSISLSKPLYITLIFAKAYTSVSDLYNIPLEFNPKILFECSSDKSNIVEQIAKLVE